MIATDGQRKPRYSKRFPIQNRSMVPERSRTPPLKQATRSDRTRRTERSRSLKSKIQRAFLSAIRCKPIHQRLSS